MTTKPKKEAAAEMVPDQVAPDAAAVADAPELAEAATDAAVVVDAAAVEAPALVIEDDAADAPADAPALLDATQLRKAIAEIEGSNSDLSREALLDGIRATGGTAGEGEDGIWTIGLTGIEVTGPTAKAALDLWCSKARRACLSGEAV